MNAKQRKFADEYLKDANATQAAIRAGYPAKSANSKGAQLAGYVSVRKYINEKQAELSRNAGFTAERIMAALWDNHEAGVSMGQLAASNKALELIGKQVGMFRDRVEVEQIGEQPKQVMVIAGQRITLK